jgi:hypothetical protein
MQRKHYNSCLQRRRTRVCFASVIGITISDRYLLRFLTQNYETLSIYVTAGVIATMYIHIYVYT